MKKVIISVLTICLLSGVWAGLRFTALLNGWLLTPWAKPDDRENFVERLKQEMDQHVTGNAVYALLEEGAMVDSHFISLGKPVDEMSVFGVASVSKWITAMAVMRLVQQGQLDLDTPVSQYLKRWKLPKSQFDNERVTLRLLLSHTAGIEDGLGHNGFAPNEPIQPLPEHLTQAADADPGISGRVAVTQPPGEKWQYSGGSYNLIQLIIEDVTRKGFDQAMQELLFQPLGLEHSYFQVKRDDPLLADYFGQNQSLREYPNYTSLAATGLYTNLTDMHKLVVENLLNPDTATAADRLLSPESLTQMQTPQGFVSGQPIWGAGVMLFAPTESGFIMGHGGKSPYLNASVRFDPESGDGFIMFQTGNDAAIASDIATQWTLWKTGYPDIYLVNNRMKRVQRDIIWGIGVICLLVLLVNIHQAKRAKKRS